MPEADGAAILLQQAQGGVLTLTLNRPAQRNAMNLALVLALRQALADAEAKAEAKASDAPRIVVLRGAGGHFCAGADLADLAAARQRLDQDPEAIVRVSEAFGDLCVAFAQSPLAVVAVLEGTVMGGGFGLACVADVALAHASAVFRLPETRLGVVPAQIAPFLVERLGYAEAKRLAVTGGRLDAREALALRLVHECHDDAAALDAALARTCGEILQCAPGAVAATKALVAHARLHAPAGMVHRAAEVFAAAALGPEGAEGTAAFLERRAPSWAPAKDPK